MQPRALKRSVSIPSPYPWPWLIKRGVQSRRSLITARRAAGISQIAATEVKWLRTNPRQSSAVPATSRLTLLQRWATPLNAWRRGESAPKATPARKDSRSASVQHRASELLAQGPESAGGYGIDRARTYPMQLGRVVGR